ncbi:tRNA (cytidine(34)-2'-O)-methyltransferase [Raoultibacter timonensis]|uniref:tRNA (cytidine(34)-2'-O)-methyltransferase n=1 Tax=Raoultibacter timonensis TaxID=1907662 RepID=UPI0026DDAC5B|nr:tRNA (cytidine(34)-2'-O)-methyltransferase [Raoultibacter timonensis]
MGQGTVGDGAVFAERAAVLGETPACLGRSEHSAGPSCASAARDGSARDATPPEAGCLHIVLFEPEIPQNTGNIARTCACTGAVLHLVEPMGFRLTEKHLGRAGLDYWDEVEIVRHACTAAFLEEHGERELHFFTGHAARLYTEALYGAEPFLVFGRESRGIDERILEAHPGKLVRIPMREGLRSLNLSNAVAVGAYEVLRQRGFSGLR